MAKILEMPKLSPTMEEGVLSAWHKKEGDEVAVDDLLAEVETDKATMEFRAFDKGTLLKLLVPTGALVKLGQPVAIMGNAGEDVAGLVPKASPGASATSTSTSTSTPTPPRPKGNPLDRTEHAPPPPQPTDRILASPYVRKSAREMDLDLAGARGSGPGGRVVASDLPALKQGAQQALARSSPQATPTSHALAFTRPGQPPSGPWLAEPESRPLSMMRKTIARRLTESKQTVPHFYLTIDVDADELVHLRERINSELAATATPPARDGEPAATTKVSLNDLLIKACAAALVRVPECNAQFSPDAILIHHRVDISVAVAIPEGLVTPVVRNADLKSVVAIAREVRELAARARAKKLTPEEMTNGTFSISNLGMFGVDAFSAVINPPEGAILAVGQVRDVPVVRDGAVAAGKKLVLTLSCDHRVVDGAIGAAFLSELRALLEHPMRVLTG